MPTPEEIRQLDGPALTRLAYDLEMDPLHPTLGWREYSPRTWRDGTTTYHSTTGQEWAPHVDLLQAETVFRRLRTQGWMLSNTWIPQRPDGWRGYLEAIKGTIHIGEHYTLETEARALLLISVLAVASKQPSVDNGD